MRILYWVGLWLAAGMLVYLTWRIDWAVKAFGYAFALAMIAAAAFVLAITVRATTR